MHNQPLLTRLGFCAILANTFDATVTPLCLFDHTFVDKCVTDASAPINVSQMYSAHSSAVVQAYFVLAQAGKQKKQTTIIKIWHRDT